MLLSDTITGLAFEHHQSSEDGTDSRYFAVWEKGERHDLLSHEYTHSWNGKFRRPADLWTPNFNVPMQGDLLWVYEGMTNYLGNMLAARSGMWSPQQTRDILARTAAKLAAGRGRDWRTLADTTNEPAQMERPGSMDWLNWQRFADFYDEGTLIWLEVDTKIRQLTGDRRSLDDFCKAFFGVYNGSFVTVPYTLDNVVRSLNDIAPYDWKSFFASRVNNLPPEVPENGLTQGGYRLIYSDVPIEPQQSGDFTNSLGFFADPQSGSIGDVTWGGWAFKAGVLPQMKLMP